MTSVRTLTVNDPLSQRTALPLIQLVPQLNDATLDNVRMVLHPNPLKANHAKASIFTSTLFDEPPRHMRK